MDLSLVCPSHGGGLSWLNLAYNRVNTYHYKYDMAEAKNHFRLDYNSISYIYKVFKHLPIQWMVIWMHPYFIKAMEVDSLAESGS